MKKNSKTNLNLKKPGGYNNVSVKNCLIPPELPSKSRHPPPQTGSIAQMFEVRSLFIGGPGSDTWVSVLIPGKEPVGKKD